MACAIRLVRSQKRSHYFVYKKRRVSKKLFFRSEGVNSGHLGSSLAAGTVSNETTCAGRPRPHDTASSSCVQAPASSPFHQPRSPPAGSTKGGFIPVFLGLWAQKEEMLMHMGVTWAGTWRRRERMVAGALEVWWASVGESWTQVLNIKLDGSLAPPHHTGAAMDGFGRNARNFVCLSKSPRFFRSTVRPSAHLQLQNFIPEKHLMKLPTCLKLVICLIWFRLWMKNWWVWELS